MRAVALDTTAALSPEAWSCRDCGGANPGLTAYCGSCGARWSSTRPEDVREVTALFADISGFTTLADTLEVEALHDVIRPLIAGLARVAERYDGFITKYAGDALLVLFGAPVAHEDDPQRALLAALEMHAALPGLLARIGPVAEGLTIHVGVNTGRVVAGRTGSDGQADYSVLGDSVILAQRLESVCPSGQTYVGETTYERTKDEFDFEDVGELALKGKLRTVRGFRLMARRAPRVAAHRRLVGRTAELQVLDSALDAAVAGQRAVVTVSGEPGSGKTRLLVEARERAAARGVRWLPARCLSYGASLPYWPIADLLRAAVGLRVEDPAETSRARLAAAVPAEARSGAERLLGLSTTTVSPEQARREVHDAVATWLTVAAQQTPVALVVEDAHWADAATLELLGELVRTTSGLPLAVVLATRPADVDVLAPAVGDVEHRRVDVHPLDDVAAAELVADVLGAPAAPRLLRFLLGRTGGNPLFLEELSRSLSETGALVHEADGWDVGPGFDLATVPTTVERVFAGRVDSLPADAVEVLSMAAVIGRTARTSLLRAALDGAELAPRLDVLVWAGLLDPVVDADEPAVAFHHALLHDVVYGRLLRKHRRSLHRKVADTGLRLYGDGDETVDLLARHLYLAGAGGEAADALLRAGRRAARLYANDAAVVHLERALEVLGSDLRALVAAGELAGVLELLGRYDEALLYFRAAGDVVGEAGVLSKQGAYDEALGLLASALERRPADRPQLLLQQARVALAAGRPGLSLQAIRLGLREAPGDATTGAFLVELLHNETDAGQPEFALAHGRRAVALLERTGDLVLLARALRIVADAQRRTRRLDEAAASLARAGALAEQTGGAEEAAATLANLGLVHQERGDLAEAMAATRRALALAERLGHRSGRTACLVNLADMLLGAGRVDDARRAADEALASARADDNRHLVAVATTTTAEVALAAGDDEAAAALAAQARDVAASLSLNDLVEIADRVEAAALARRRPAVAEVPAAVAAGTSA